MARPKGSTGRWPRNRLVVSSPEQRKQAVQDAISLNQAIDEQKESRREA